MRGSNSSVYIRMTFQLDGQSLSKITKLTLGMKYDDGFIAYLNGTEVIRVNAPENATWNSEADDTLATCLRKWRAPGRPSA